jgi:formylglycine-generating enzyme required for sulfatase activity
MTTLFTSAPPLGLRMDVRKMSADKDATPIREFIMRIVSKVAFVIIVLTLAPMSLFADPAQDRQYKPGETFKDCRECPEMVVVPAGSFIMGSPENEEGRTPPEGPQHRVTFSQPFAVSKFPVTFDEWDACLADGGCDDYKPSDSNWGRGKRPVINVSWNDAQAYISWLRRKTGRNYHLLSEAQREYVTRAGTTSPFWWGALISHSQANFNDGSHHEFHDQTAPVDSFQPNPWGLYQVHGNVFDWTEDCWNESYQGAPTDGSAWTSGDCNSRVARGGAWDTYPRHLRSAHRNRYIATN